MKKIILIQPPGPYLLIDRWALPLSLLYLKGFLEKQNHQVKLINLAGIKDYLEAIPLDGDIYGVTIFTPQHDIALDIAKHLRKYTGALLVAGGHHVTAIPEEFLRESEFDVVVRGEGEFIFADICNGKAFKEISGICYKQNGKILRNPDRDFCKDINVIPFPRFDCINLSEYGRVYINKPYSKYSVDIMTSRGCPRACVFCASSSFWKRKIRFHSAEYIYEYLDYLCGEGINDFIFVDDDFLLNYSRVEKICRKLESMQSKWACTTHSNCITPELANLIAKSGCQKVSLGIEACTDRVLQLINKQTTVEDHRKAISILLKAGLKILAFVMVGLPGEDQDSINDTIRFLREQPIDYYTVSNLVPWPGTPIWKNPERYGYELDRDRPYSGFCYFNQELQPKPVSIKEREVLCYREMLINASRERCTNLESLKFACSQNKKT